MALKGRQVASALAFLPAMGISAVCSLSDGESEPVEAGPADKIWLQPEIK